ncbi:MAG: hypothetical protein R3F59_09900 [Myxococcota bacterium]
MLVLDDAEHLLSALAEVVGALLDGVGDLRILVTSRERLRLGGEVTVPLGGLARADAVRLFLERAGAVRPGWGEGEADTVAAVAAELDDNPLAIELAAGRAEVLDPPALLQALDERFALLGSARRDGEARQASLYRAIDWSWTLLPPELQRVLAVCGVFEDGFSAAAADAVLTDDDVTGGETRQWALDQVQDLVSRSLVQVRSTAVGQVRFALASSIRAFAWAKAQERGEAELARARHAAWFVAMAQRRRTLRADVLLLDAGNLDAARAHARGEDAAALALALDRVYEAYGPLDARLRVLTEALAQSPPPASAAALHLARARAACFAGSARWEEDLARALVLSAEGDAAFEREALLARAELTHFVGGDVRAAARAAAERARREGDPRIEASALTLLSLVEGTVEHVARLDDLLREVPDPLVQVEALHVLAFVAAGRGQPDRAVALCEEAVAVALAAGDRKQVAILQGSLGAILARAGRLEPALERMVAAAEGLRRIGVLSSYSFANAALIALVLGRRAECAVLAERALDDGGPRWSGLGILGTLHVVSGAPEPGRDAFEEALRAAGAVAAVGPDARAALGVAGGGLRRLGDLDAAAYWLDAATPTCRAPGSARGCCSRRAGPWRWPWRPRRRGAVRGGGRRHHEARGGRRVGAGGDAPRGVDLAVDHLRERLGG